MTLIALCSLKGSPGVTTAAVGLAARWPRGEQPVVVECDPAGGDLLARFRLETSPSLVSLAAAARRAADPGLIWQHAQRLPGGLPVVVGPVGAVQAHAALGQLAGQHPSVLRRAADRTGTVVVADCGRADPHSPALPVMRAADAVLLFARARDDSSPTRPPPSIPPLAGHAAPTSSSSAAAIRPTRSPRCWGSRCSGGCPTIPRAPPR